MVLVTRFLGNPILTPNTNAAWESQAVFNGCPVVADDAIHMLYRAMGAPVDIQGKRIEISTIGDSISFDRVQFLNRKQLIAPEHDWERFGCEDPRVTKLDGKYYIFYTALAEFPPVPAGITVALAVTRDFQRIEEKYHITPFNAKAMALFPEKINGRRTAILTVNTDLPPSKIAIAAFDNEPQMWDERYWQSWYGDLDHHVVPLLRSIHDHIEVGAPPVRTEDGWLLIYCYIRNYQSSSRIFGIEAVLLDSNDPKRVIGRCDLPLLYPDRPYEMAGKIPGVIFPSGALIHNNNLGIYYGAADTTVCLATCRVDELLKELQPNKGKTLFKQKLAVKKFSGNPIISPIPEHDWESKFTLNPAAVTCNQGNVHILYRAQGKDDTSVLGYAMSRDGVHIDERLVDPVYVPREEFEMKKKPGFSGCEDPRITRLGDKLYMCYTAFDGVNPARVALTSILVEDFCNQRWNWAKPILISPPGEWDKDAAMFPEKINGKYVFLHRLGKSIWIDAVDDLNFTGNSYLGGRIIMDSRPDKWDNEKIGIGPPPIKTDAGWLLIYHGINKEDLKYRQGAALLDLADPTRVIGQLDYPLLEPESAYQKKGLRPGTVFVCGAVVRAEEIYMYYGAADQLVCVASVNLESVVKELQSSR